MFLEGRNHLSRSVEVGSSIALRRDSREVTVTTKCEFILCISHCSRFLPKRSLHLEQIDIELSSNMNKILMDNYKGQAGNKQGAVRESNGFILRSVLLPTISSTPQLFDGGRAGIILILQIRGLWHSPRLFPFQCALPTAVLGN